MEELKYSQETIALGKKLIRDFSAHDKRDLTLGWMAHYLSELIVSAEQEQEEAKKAELNRQACEMILTLWQNRNDFPRGTRPLTGLSSAVEVIRSLRKRDPGLDYWQRNMEYKQNGPWGNFAETVRNSSENIFALAVFASVTEDALTREKEWSEFPNLLSEQEREMLEYIDEILTRDEAPIKIRFTSPGKKEEPKEVEKMDKVLARMEKLLKKQTAQFDALKRAVLKGRELDAKTDSDDDWEDAFYNLHD
ncbi:hypothetical protein ACSBL2_11955 [Pedobacter sp. AW31-3R]|uniref:hypothetical protein n=1 Tax=Pedobacter sp. AW31-3R TaxID=3445781 RepID=UPI003F9ED3C2